MNRLIQGSILFTLRRLKDYDTGIDSERIIHEK
jgi:hypothetical protein